MCSVTSAEKHGELVFNHQHCFLVVEFYSINPIWDETKGLLLMSQCPTGQYESNIIFNVSARSLDNIWSAGYKIAWISCTDGGGAVIRPPWGFSEIAEKPRRVAPRNLAWLFPHQFRTWCASFDLLHLKVRSPGHFEWHDLEPLFCSFATVSQLQLMTERFESCRM